MIVRNPVFAIGALLLIGTVVPGGPVDSRGQTVYETSRVDTLRELGAALRDGGLERALETLEDYTALYPCDAVMHYNLACVRAMVGDAEGAGRSLDQAFARGYMPLDRATNDPDLAALQATGVADSLVEHHRHLRQERRRAASLIIEEGTWISTPELVPEFGPCVTTTHDVAVAVMSDPDGFRVRLTGGNLETMRVDVLVGVPRGPDTVVTRRIRTWSGLATEPLGRVRWNGRPERDVVARSSVARVDDGVVHTFAWSDLAGVGPPLDPVVAFNVRVWPSDAPRAAIALVPDPFVGSGSVLERRHADLDIYPADPPQRWLRGRLPSNAVIGDSLAVDLVAQGFPGGAVTITSTVRSAAGTFVDPPRRLELEPEIAFLTTTIGLAGRAGGMVEIEIVATWDAGPSATWQARALALDEEWFVRQQRRVEEEITPAERSILMYRLFRVLESLRVANPDDPVEDLAASVETVDGLLARGSREGTVLPTDATGPTTMEVAFPIQGASLAPATLIQPASRGENAPVVIWFTQGAEPLAGSEPTAGEPWQVIVPIEDRIDDPDAAPIRVRHAVAWARALFPDRSLSVAATGLAVAATLRGIVGADVDVDVEELRVLLRGPLDPWPGADADAMRSALARHVETLTLEVAPLRALGARGRQVLSLLEEAGVRIVRREPGSDVEARSFIIGGQRDQ